MTPRTLATLLRPLRGKIHVVKAHVLRRVPQRFHAITDEMAKFGTIGLINLVVNFAVFNLLWLTVLRSGEVKAKAVATIVATTCAYFLNRHWTYRDRPKSTLRREYFLFFIFNVVGLVIEVTVVGIAKYGFHATHIVVLNICTAIGIALGTIFRFWAYRTHVFRPAEEPSPEDTEIALAAAIADADPADVEADFEHHHTPAPAHGTPARANGSPAPNGTPAPVDGGPTPANGTPAPVNGTPAPVNGTPAPVNGTPAPVDGAAIIGTLNGARLKGTPANGGGGHDEHDDEEDRALRGELVELELNDIVDQAERSHHR